MSRVDYYCLPRFHLLLLLHQRERACQWEKSLNPNQWRLLRLFAKYHLGWRSSLRAVIVAGCGSQPEALVDDKKLSRKGPFSRAAGHSHYGRHPGTRTATEAEAPAAIPVCLSSEGKSETVRKTCLFTGLSQHARTRVPSHHHQSAVQARRSNAQEAMSPSCLSFLCEEQSTTVSDYGRGAGGGWGAASPVPFTPPDDCSEDPVLQLTLDTPRTTLTTAYGCHYAAPLRVLISSSRRDRPLAHAGFWFWPPCLLLAPTLLRAGGFHSVLSTARTTLPELTKRATGRQA